MFEEMFLVLLTMPAKLCDTQYTLTLRTTSCIPQSTWLKCKLDNRKATCSKQDKSIYVSAPERLSLLSTKWWYRSTAMRESHLESDQLRDLQLSSESFDCLCPGIGWPWRRQDDNSGHQPQQPHLPPGRHYQLGPLPDPHTTPGRQHLAHASGSLEPAI